MEISHFALPWRGQRSFRYIGSREDLAQVQCREHVMVGGELVFMSLGDTVPGPEFMRQPDRPAERKLPLAKSARMLHVWVDREALELRCARMVLACDHYLRWGLASRKDIVLVGGYPQPHATIVCALVFTSHRLVEVRERSLPPEGGDRFRLDLWSFLADLRQDFRDLDILLAAPLTQVSDAELTAGTAWIGDTPFDRLVHYPLLRPQTPVSRMVEFAWPAGIALAAIALYFITLGLDWMGYGRAVSAYRSASAGIVQRGASLEQLQQRRFFLEESAIPAQVDRMSFLERLSDLIATQIEKVRIEQVTLYATKTPSIAGTSGAHPEGTMIDFVFAITVPRDEQQSARGQADRLLERLTQHMSIKLYLIGHSEQAGVAGQTDSGTRTFTVEGVRV